MGTIGHGYGSEWHLLRYLGYHRQDLNKAVLKSIGGQDGGRIEWMDFKFSGENKKLRLEKEWAGIDFLSECTTSIPGLDFGVVQGAWKQYWPQTGTPPNWDAVGMLRRNGSPEILLVEAKAHSEELASTCGAGKRSREKISRAMEETIKSFGSTTADPNEWLEGYYQYCNRLAVLHFLRQRNGIPVRLIMIYFCGEMKKDGWTCPKDEQEWSNALDPMYVKLGLGQTSPLMSFVNKVFLNCGQPEGVASDAPDKAL
jgi:hypothetical protein